MGRKEGLTGTLSLPTLYEVPFLHTPACTLHECAINVDAGRAPAPKRSRHGERDEALVAADVEHLAAPEPSSLHTRQRGGGASQREAALDHVACHGISPRNNTPFPGTTITARSCPKTIPCLHQAQSRVLLKAA